MSSSHSYIRLSPMLVHAETFPQPRRPWTSTPRHLPHVVYATRLSASYSNIMSSSSLSQICSPYLSYFRTTFLTSLEESRGVWIFLYFVFNLGLTLYNKTVLTHFPFPFTVTAIHALFGVLGSAFLLHARVLSLPALGSRDKAIIFLFSCLYAVNIAISNVSLKLVTVPFHQVVRSSTPIFTAGLSFVILRTRTSRMKMLTLVPVVIGVGFATYGEYDYNLWGFALTLLGAVLAAFKTVLTSYLQTLPSPIPTPTQQTSKPSLWSPSKIRTFCQSPSLSLHPLSLLAYLSPLAFIHCVLLAYYSGELTSVRLHCADGISAFKLLALGMNGVIAYGLNVVSFTANKRVGPLAITVAANVKQVLTILCAIGLFNLTISLTNSVGIFLTLLGGACYAWTEYREKISRP